jgi:hypothetical protein
VAVLDAEEMDETLMADPRCGRPPALQAGPTPDFNNNAAVALLLKRTGFRFQAENFVE